jgi:type IV secretory pathway component VirB8
MKLVENFKNNHQPMIKKFRWNVTTLQNYVLVSKINDDVVSVRHQKSIKRNNTHDSTHVYSPELCCDEMHDPIFYELSCYELCFNTKG